MPKVSVIVPNYNHAPFLPQRLDSILDQTFPDYELILLDDCSTDGSGDIIQHYKARHPAVRVFVNERNSGSPFRQWDFGVMHAEGDYIWIAESDDWADRDFLREMVPLLDNNRNVGLAYCDSMITNERNQSAGPVSLNHFPHDSRRTRDYFNNGKDEIAHHLCIANCINNVSGVLFRKNSYVAAGYADHSMRYCGDWFLYLRILSMTDIAYRAKPLNFLRLHAGSSCHGYYTDDAYLEEAIRIYNFVMQNVSTSSKTRKAIYDQLSLHCCMAVRKRLIPSKKVFRDVKRIVPFFEFHVLRFLTGHVMRKCLRSTPPSPSGEL